MKCYFDKKKTCPVPVEHMGGTMCLACMMQEIGKTAAKEIAKQTKHAEASQVYKSKDTKDERRMEIG